MKKKLKINHINMAFIISLNNDIEKLHKIREKYLKIHKKIKNYKNLKISKNFNIENKTKYFMKYMIYCPKVEITEKEKEKEIEYIIQSRHDWRYTRYIDIKYKKFNPIYIDDVDNKRHIEYYDTDTYFSGFLLNNGKILTNSLRSIFYNNIIDYLNNTFDDTKLDKITYFSCPKCYTRNPYLTLLDTQKNNIHLKRVSRIEYFYEVLAYNIAKDKGGQLLPYYEYYNTFLHHFLSNFLF